MADAIITLPRAGTVEVIQEFAAAAAAPARPTLVPCVIGSCFQIAEQRFAGFYFGRFLIGDELVGVGTGIQLIFNLVNGTVLTATVELHIATIGGTLLVQGVDYNVQSSGQITLTPAGVAALGVQALHAAYSYAPTQQYVYPELKQGAEVENPGDVTVSLRTVEDIFDITNGFGVIINETTVNVPGDVSPSRNVSTINGQVEITAVTGAITDTSIDYFAIGVRAGDILRFISNPALLERSNSIVATDAADHAILSIPSLNQITFSPTVAPQGGKVEYQIVRPGSQNGDILISYKARRIDKVGVFLEYESTTTMDDDIGPIVPENPLAFGLARCLGSTDKVVFAMMVRDQDDLEDHQKALELLEGEEIYLLVPLTTNQAVHGIYLAHCDQMSAPDNMHERRVIVTQKARTRKTYQSALSTGAMGVSSTIFTDFNAQFLTNGVPVGSVIRLASPVSIELADVARAELIVASVISETQLNIVQAVTHGTDITLEDVGVGTGAQLLFQLNATQDVIPSSVLMFLNGVQVSALDHSVTPAGGVTFIVAPGLGIDITGSYEITTIAGIQYTVESQELTNFEIAQDVAAVGNAYKNRRITVTHAEKVIADDGAEVEPYFMNCSIAGLSATLAPNQPIANVPIPGFLGVKHIRKFNEQHFGLMAAYGITVYIQDRDTSPVVMRNWITTDTLNVNTRECSIVQMVDYYSKFLRTNVKSIAGRFNITKSFIDNMLRPSINGVNQEMLTAGFIGPRSQIVSIEQSTVNKDQIFVLEEIEFFAPANRITITVRVL
jgi:hypothetical protein